MRIWDVPPDELCTEHLLGEHREAHAVWAIITKDPRGYAHHPEVLRWKGRLAALYKRHTDIVVEMKTRGYAHRSPLDERLATGSPVQRDFLNTLEEQRRLLRSKTCRCRLRQSDLKAGLAVRSVEKARQRK